MGPLWESLERLPGLSPGEVTRGCRQAVPWWGSPWGKLIHMPLGDGPGAEISCQHPCLERTTVAQRPPWAKRDRGVLGRGVPGWTGARGDATPGSEEKEHAGVGENPPFMGVRG